jgi:hypothetical protein
MSPPTARPDYPHGLTDDRGRPVRPDGTLLPGAEQHHEVTIGGGGGALPYLRCSPCQVLVYEPEAGPPVGLARVVDFLREHGVFSPYGKAGPRDYSH